MKRALARYRNSGFRRILKKYDKHAPIVFFIGGFIFDTLTLGRIDGWYVLIVLCFHMSFLTITLFLYNLADDGIWKNTFLERFQVYFPLIIQFFFGGLSSAYVIYFSRSVSLSKTASFLVILLILLFANETLKKRISNKYLQFSVYFFISFTFFAFIIPVFISELSVRVFILSGIISLICTFFLILLIYRISPSTRAETSLGKLIAMIILIYASINIFYYFKLIPPVPLALEHGIVAHNVEVVNNKYIVSYEPEEKHIFWRKHKFKYKHKPNEKVYVFSSVFAPTALKKNIIHRWTWYNQRTEQWDIVEDLGYEILGGRDGGFRGYTYKSNVRSGLWKVEVITEEEMILGVIDFEITLGPELESSRLLQMKF